VLLQNEKMSENYNYEDPEEMRHMVKNLMAETKQLHSELQILRKIRKTYFEIFKNKNLKREVYKRDWSFSPEGNT
jgi:TRAP-type mannitol/chloroaromatic compound transport system substrate-binding protein